MEHLIEKIKEHEGYRSSVYKCTEGYDTIGYGFAIKDLELSETICDLILREKIGRLHNRLCERFDWFLPLPETIQDVVMNMAYQMGSTGVSKFKKMIKHFKAENWEEGSKEMLDSKWARQTPNRAKELAKIVEDFNG